MTSRSSGRLTAATELNVGHRKTEMRDNTIYEVQTPRLPMELTAVLTPAEEGGFVALNPETGTTTQGETVEEAISNLREATTLYLSEFPLATMFSAPERA